MTQKEILIHQLEACHDANHWFVSMGSALKGLTAKQAAADLPGKGGHSVWGLLYHITFWNERYLQKFTGTETPGPKTNDETFVPGTGTGEAEWSALVARFNKTMTDWKEAIRGADEAALAAPVGKGNGGDWHSALADMMIHTAHHIGQIVTLRKVQGSWDPAQGVT